MPKEPIKLIVNPNNAIGSVFSQLVAVTASSGNLVTIEFVYINPRDGLHGTVVSRVTLPNEAAIQLSELIPKIINANNATKKRSK